MNGNIPVKSKCAEVLTPQERTAALMAGAVAEKQAREASGETMEKEAVGGDTTRAGLNTLAIFGALGIPTGVAWHALAKSMRPDRVEERGARDRVSYYRDVASNMERKLNRMRKRRGEEENSTNVSGKR